MLHDAEWNEFRRSLSGYIRRRVRNDQETEDIVQDVFVKMLSSQSGLRQQEKLQAWMYRITKNAIVDHYRKRKSPSAPVEDAIHIPETPEETGEENENGSFAACIRSMLRKLPDKYREAVELTELAGLSQKELGEKLGISYSGAKSRVQRGKEQLKRAILDCCHVEADPYGNIVDYRARERCSPQQEGGCPS